MAACALSGCRQADRAAPHHTPSDFRGPLSLNTPFSLLHGPSPGFRVLPHSTLIKSLQAVGPDGVTVMVS